MRSFSGFDVIFFSWNIMAFASFGIITVGVPSIREGTAGPRIRTCSYRSRHSRNSVHKLGSENHIGIVEHSLLQKEKAN
jgi:hypothetical protein